LSVRPAEVLIHASMAVRVGQWDEECKTLLLLGFLSVYGLDNLLAILGNDRRRVGSLDKISNTTEQLRRPENDLRLRWCCLWKTW
jgi:hypothetical protein